ncbi:energy transducer TonB [Methylocaldum szegediense]|uniref:Periplasmic protein TonB n=1 Tax=Methylocaldum szegediense TaxID=73780 RepID=A0ABM9I0Q4_9GAMM|nr:energy transducer TonB [Methylocaldum szegediense]CAI8813408.1 periplasmic protein TonB [Methylocaldum szegediense]
MCAAALAPGLFSPGILKAGRYRGIRTVGVLGAVVVHAAVLPILIKGEAVPAASGPRATPVVIDLISMAEPQTEARQAVRTPAQPVKPKTVKPKAQAKPKPIRLPAKRSPLLSAPSEAAVHHATAAQTPPPPEASTETAPTSRAAASARSEPAPAPVTPPHFNVAYLRKPAPVYPALSRRQREQGKVVLRVLVNAAGSAETVSVHTSSGFGRLDAAALEAVKQWKFVPARQGDRPVPAWVLVPISFTLEG